MANTRPVGGAGCLLIHNYRKPTGVSEQVVLLGLESGGQYKGTFNISCGKAERSDGTFGKKALPNYWNTMNRELYEEFGCKDTKHVNLGKPRPGDLHMGPTPIWIGQVIPGYSRSMFVPNTEMLGLEYVILSDLKSSIHIRDTTVGARTIDGKIVPVSKFTLSIIREAMAKGLI